MPGTIREAITRAGSALDQQGYGLVEALVASVLLILGLGGTITVFVASENAGATAERHQAAVALAQQEIEKIQAREYEHVSLASTSYPVLETDSESPADRVEGTMYLAGGAGADGEAVAEPLAVAGGEGPVAPIEPYEAVEMVSRSGVETAHVLRFVSWRRESCPLLSLEDLELDLSETGDSVLASLSSLSLKLGDQGLIGSAAASRGTLLGLQDVDVISEQVGDLLAMIDQVLGPAETLRDEIVAPLSSQLPGAVEGLTGIDATLDLCNMDLGALRRLETVQSALAAIEPLLDSLATAGIAQAADGIEVGTSTASDAAEEDARCSSLGPVLEQVCRLVGGLLDSLVSTLDGVVAGLSDVLEPGNDSDGLTEALDSFPDELSGSLADATNGSVDEVGELSTLISDVADSLEGNESYTSTKRVTVAVQLEDGASEAPQEPIWVGTVITDPASGLVLP